jgi:S1-C subfamily serine protease
MGRIVRRSWLGPALVVVAWLAPGLVAAPDNPLPGDDVTFRPTVMVHKGKSLGTGTVISSLEGETLILTACHVIDDPGLLTVDLNRFNLGMERTREGGTFPRSLKATIAARDVSTDLAILVVRGQLPWPFVARIARGDAPPPPGTSVTSIGFDLGQKLIGMTTKVRTIERINLGRGGTDRLFVVTENPPEHGRSGGGLYRSDGALVGVCIARAEFDKGPTKGIFTTLGNIKELLRTHEKLATSVSRSSNRPTSPAR